MVGAYLGMYPWRLVVRCIVQAFDLSTIGKVIAWSHQGMVTTYANVIIIGTASGSLADQDPTLMLKVNPAVRLE
jgi:hypothetical protein